MCDKRSAFRPIGVVGVGEIPLAFVGSVALLLVLLRYASIRLGPSAQNNIKEVPMVRTLTARARTFLCSIVETIWAIGASGVAGHLSA